MTVARIIALNGQLTDKPYCTIAALNCLFLGKYLSLMKVVKSQNRQIIILNFQLLDNHRFLDNYGCCANVRNAAPRRISPPPGPPLHRSRLHPRPSHLLEAVCIYGKHGRNHGRRKSGKRSFFGRLLRNRANNFSRNSQLLYHLRHKRSQSDAAVLRARSKVQSCGAHADFGQYR